MLVTLSDGCIPQHYDHDMMRKSRDGHVHSELMRWTFKGQYLLVSRLWQAIFRRAM